MSDVFVILLCIVVVCRFAAGATVPTPAGVTQACRYWPADAVAGWWCCPAFTLSLDERDGIAHSVIFNSSGVSVGCQRQFPELSVGIVAPSESARGFTLGSAAVFGLVFGALLTVMYCVASRVGRLLCKRPRRAPAPLYVKAPSPDLAEYRAVAARWL